MIDPAVESCRDAIKHLRDNFPRSVWDAAMRMVNRERLENYQRDKRKPLSPSKVRSLYIRQKGVCPACGHPLPDPRFHRTEVHVDEIDPNRDDFNAMNNRRLLHSGCNLKKGSQSLPEQSKSTGRTVVDILGDGYEPT